MKKCIAPFLGLDDLVKASNETLYELACVIDKYFSTYCYYRLNKKFTSQDDRVLNLMGWIDKYCCDIRFEINDWNSSSHYESRNNEYVFRNVSRMVL